MNKAILVERNYKGEYERFALTPEEFEKEFSEFLSEGMPPPPTDGDTYTLAPLVHIWYMATEVGNPDWNSFFTDMSWGLSESDIDSGNLAYIREDFMQSLKKYLPKEEKTIPEQAQALLDDILKKPDGAEVFYAAGIMRALQEDDILDRSELLTMTQRITELAYCSAVPLLTAERADAVRTLLNYGLTASRSPEFPEATPEQMKEFLLTCDIDVFAEIVETVAVNNQTFYAPDNQYSQDAIEAHQKAVDAILAVTEKKPSLAAQISSAEARTTNSANTSHKEQEPTR